MPDLSSFLPLTPAQFHILASLAREPRHGYGVMQEVESRSGGTVRLGAGTLYTSLKRMLEDGLVDESDDKADSSERRRYYALSSLGRAVLRADARRLEELVRYARSEKILDGRSA